MPVLIRDGKTGDVIRRSENLHGIVDHARRVGVEWVRIEPADHGEGYLAVMFADRSSCEIRFASWEVLRAWVRRARWPGGAPVTEVHGE